MKKRLKEPDYFANFDSATAMLRGVANHLNDRDLPMMGTPPKLVANALRPVGRLLNSLPVAAREKVYALTGWAEAISPDELGDVSAEYVAEWMISLYPEREYPAVVIGSASGALAHLCCALGVPFLPQTFLIPVARSGIHPDEPLGDMEWGREPARRLLTANPELQLHHMNEANQDRLMIQHMTYFRVKRLVLGRAFERFIERGLAPGGTIILSECTLRWPTIGMGERYVFQHGALGGASPEEFHEGSERVAEYLQRYGSHRRSWALPGQRRRPSGGRVGLRGRSARGRGEVRRGARLPPAAPYLREPRASEPGGRRPAPRVVHWAGHALRPSARKLVHRARSSLGTQDRLGAMVDDLQQGALRRAPGGVPRRRGAVRGDPHDALRARCGVCRPRPHRALAGHTGPGQEPRRIRRDGREQVS